MVYEEILLKNGATVILREANKDDAQGMIDHMHLVTGETKFLTYGPGEFVITLEEEQEFVEKTATSVNEIFLLALVDSIIVGIGGIHSNDKARIRHIGNLGLSLQQSYWGLGIGSHMMQVLLTWAKGTNVIRKIDLSVVVENTTAVALYKKFGFEKEGLIRRNMYVDGSFYDSYYMGLLID